MSAIVCGKRSSFFEEIQGSSSSSSLSSSSNPINKRIRCSSSPVRFPQPAFLLIDQLVSIFPFMDKEGIDQALENSGHDLDSAIESLKDLHLGYAAENHHGAACTSSDTYPQSSNQAHVHGDHGVGLTEDPLASRNSPVDGTEWVELVVQEMCTSSNMDDARVRALQTLEAYDKSVYAHASKEAAQAFQQENMMLKEQVEALIQENGILKRAVSIQHERQKEYDTMSQEVQQLKQLVTRCQEHIRTLEVNNYALAMHLKQAQQNNTMPGRSNPDVF